jgi:hypothetical protein
MSAPVAPLRVFGSPMPSSIAGLPFCHRLEKGSLRGSPSRSLSLYRTRKGEFEVKPLKNPLPTTGVEKGV